MACGLVWLHVRIPNRHVFDLDWIICSKHDNMLGSVVNIFGMGGGYITT